MLDLLMLLLVCFGMVDVRLNLVIVGKKCWGKLFRLFVKVG